MDLNNVLWSNYGMYTQYPQYVDLHNRQVEEIARLNNQVTSLNKEVACFNTEVASLNTEVASLNTEVASLKKKTQEGKMCLSTSELMKFIELYRACQNNEPWDVNQALEDDKLEYGFKETIHVVVDTVLSRDFFNWDADKKDACEILTHLMGYAATRGCMLQPIAVKDSLRYIEAWRTPEVMLKALALGVPMQWPRLCEYHLWNIRYCASVLPRRQLLALARGQRAITDLLRMLMRCLVDDSVWIPPPPVAEVED